LEDLTRARTKDEARGGGFGEAPAAAEERDAEGILELANLLAQGGLGDVEALGGPGEIALLGDGDDIPEMAKFHKVYHTIGIW
jgi:hypothetical protein